MSESFEGPRPLTGEWETIGRYVSLGEASVPRGVLEGAGIPCRFLDESTIGVAWHLSNAVGGIKLQVDRVYREDALALLGAGETEFLPEESAPDFNSEPEPAFAESKREVLARRALMLSILGFVLPIVLHLWSLVILLRIPEQKGTLGARGKRWCVIAGVLDLAAIGVLIALLLRA